MGPAESVEPTAYLVLGGQTLCCTIAERVGSLCPESTPKLGEVSGSWTPAMKLGQNHSSPKCLSFAVLHRCPVLRQGGVGGGETPSCFNSEFPPAPAFKGPPKKFSSVTKRCPSRMDDYVVTLLETALGTVSRPLRLRSVSLLTYTPYSRDRGACQGISEFPSHGPCSH